jgi:hypothetical protein
MNSIEATLWSWSPVPDSRVAAYSLFMFNGSVPFTAKDLQGLWDEWRQSDLATHAVANTSSLHPLSRYGPVTAQGYNPQWVTEREKFYNLFRQFLALNQDKTSASLFLIYPDGQETQWTPQGTAAYRSNRGPQLLQVMKALQQPGELGLGVTVQYTYNDKAEIYATPQTRAFDNGYQSALYETIKKAELIKNVEPPLLPTMTEEPLPLAVWRDFWNVFRNRQPELVQRYGQSDEPISPEFARLQGLYLNPETGIQAFFQRLATADAHVPAEKLLMGNFIYDAGFQYALVRLTPSLRQMSGKQDYWDWVKLPATPGTQYISSMAPAHVRMVVKGLYMEP